VGDVCILEAYHQRTELGLTEPLRYMAFEHPTLTVTAGPFAGYDKYKTRIALARGSEKSQECRMRFALRQTMKVEAAIDCLFAASHTRTHAAPKRRKRWRHAFATRDCSRSAGTRGRGSRWSNVIGRPIIA
jgi:hypothetical protein